MLGTDKLLFLHLHKSGGTYINTMLLRCVPFARQIGYHLPYREVPAEYRQRPVLGTVRSPWAYYVSWYHFQLGQNQPNVLFQICSNEGRLNFAETVANLVCLSEDERRLSQLESAVPQSFTNFGLNLTKACVRELRGRGVGFYTYLYDRLYDGTTAPNVIPIERITETLPPILASLGQLPNPCITRFLAEAPHMNTSQHGVPASYYDHELAALIANRDRAIIDGYGYSL